MTGGAAMSETICGYVVVRQPDHVAPERIAPRLKIGNKTYRGLDRSPWEDLDQMYFDRKLPASLQSIRDVIEVTNRDLSGIKVLKSHQLAQEVLRHAGEASEIIAIWSRELEELKGAEPAGIDLTLLGFDCFAMGEWSVLRDGVYALPDHFTAFVLRLNEHGLSSSEDDCAAVFRTYIALSAKDIVEPLAANAVPMIVKIFAV
jgi:hypothetical protein